MIRFYRLELIYNPRCVYSYILETGVKAGRVHIIMRAKRRKQGLHVQTNILY